MRIIYFILSTCFLFACSKDDGNDTLKADVINKQIYNEFSEQPNDAFFLPSGNICMVVTSKENNGLKFLVLSQEDGSVISTHDVLNQANVFARDVLNDGDRYFVLADSELGVGYRNVTCVEVSTSFTLNSTFTIPSEHHEVAVKMISKENGTYSVLVNRKNKNTDTWGFVIYEVENNQVVDSHVFPHGNLQSASDILKKQNGEGYYVFAHSVEDPLRSTDFVLYELNNDFQILKKKYFGGNRYEEARQMLEDDLGQIYLLGHSASKDIQHEIYLVKLDENLNTIYEKHYGSPFHDGGQAFCFDGNHRLTIIGRTDAPSNTNEGIYYLKVNTQGNVIHQQYLGDDLANRSDVVLNMDGVDYILGYTTIDQNFTKNIEFFRVSYQ